MKTIANFFKQGTTESSMRLVFILSAIVAGFGICVIDVKFAYNLVKYSGTDIALVIAANTAYLVGVIYGKVQQMKQENTQV
jgi:hypothetical protein